MVNLKGKLKYFLIKTYKKFINNAYNCLDMCKLYYDFGSK